MEMKMVMGGDGCWVWVDDACGDDGDVGVGGDGRRQDVDINAMSLSISLCLRVSVASLTISVSYSGGGKGSLAISFHYLWITACDYVDGGTRPIFDEEPLEQYDSNTTPDSKDMSNNRGEAGPDKHKF
nr:hypothetical protein [Tanacetum cinerariifolium]